MIYNEDFSPDPGMGMPEGYSDEKFVIDLYEELLEQNRSFGKNIEKHLSYYLDWVITQLNYFIDDIYCIFCAFTWVLQYQSLENSLITFSHNSDLVELTIH